jgi:hypothetical protein
MMFYRRIHEVEVDRQWEVVALAAAEKLDVMIGVGGYPARLNPSRRLIDKGDSSFPP